MLKGIFLPYLTDDKDKEAILRSYSEKDKVDELLKKYGTYAYDVLRNIPTYASSKTNLFSLEIKTPKQKQDALFEQFYNGTLSMDEALKIINSNNKFPYLNVTEDMIKKSAAKYQPNKVTPAVEHEAIDVDPKLSKLLKRTIGSDELADDLTKKYGKDAYKIALSAVIEPSNVINDLRVKTDGKLSSRNLLSTLAKDSTTIDKAKLTTFLNGYSERNNPRGKTAQEAAPATNEIPQRIKPVEASPVTIPLNVVKKPEKIEIKSIPFVQDGKLYDLYHLPEGFVIKGDLDLSNRGLTELPDLSNVKVKGSLLLSGNELTSIDGVLPKVGKNIDLRDNKLTSLKGLPEVVNKHLACGGNQLTTLEGAPREVKGAFDCRNNNLTTLVGGPEKVGGAYVCSGNKLTDLKGAPEEIKINFDCMNNYLKNLDNAPKVKGDTLSDFSNEEISPEHDREELKQDLKNAYKIAEFKKSMPQNGAKTDEEKHLEEILDTPRPTNNPKYTLDTLGLNNKENPRD